MSRYIEYHSSFVVTLYPLTIVQVNDVTATDTAKSNNHATKLATVNKLINAQKRTSKLLIQQKVSSIYSNKQ